MKLLKNCLIIIGSTLPYNFPADYIKQTAKILAMYNKVIIFLWGDALSIKELISCKKRIKIIGYDKNIILFTPLHYIPFRRFELIRQLNLFINVLLLRTIITLKVYKGLFKKIILWIFNYEFYNLPKFMGKDILSLYDCVEQPSSLNIHYETIIRAKEKYLIKNVKFFFVNSKALVSLYKECQPIIVPQGFAVETYKKNCVVRIKNNFILFKKIKNPIMGYIGGINYRLDFDMLIKLAYKCPKFSFVFIGAKQKNSIEDVLIKTNFQVKKLFSLPNVYYYPEIPKDDLPQIISMFKVCLIPYNINISFNKYCYPMKLFEYFYMGKPVISTPILELQRFTPYIKIAKDAKGFEKEIKNILKNGWPKEYIKKQKQSALENSWKAKIEKISYYLKKEFPEKFND